MVGPVIATRLCYSVYRLETERNYTKGQGRQKRIDNFTDKNNSVYSVDLRYLTFRVDMKMFKTEFTSHDALLHVLLQNQHDTIIAAYTRIHNPTFDFWRHHTVDSISQCYFCVCNAPPLWRNKTDKKLCYRRRTARRVMFVKMLLTVEKKLGYTANRSNGVGWLLLDL